MLHRQGSSEYALGTERNASNEFAGQSLFLAAVDVRTFHPSHGLTATISRRKSPQQFNMPKSLNKVQKHITKKKGKINALHVNSRDSKSLLRAGGRDQKVAKLASLREKANRPYSTYILIICNVKRA
jgi:Translation machinery-associated protein 16